MKRDYIRGSYESHVAWPGWPGKAKATHLAITWGCEVALCLLLVDTWDLCLSTKCSLSVRCRCGRHGVFVPSATVKPQGGGPKHLSRKSFYANLDPMS